MRNNCNVVAFPDVFGSDRINSGRERDFDQWDRTYNLREHVRPRQHVTIPSPLVTRGAFTPAARPRTVFMCVSPFVPFPLTKSLVPRSTCSYMRLYPTPILLRFSQTSSVQWSSFHPCYRPLRFVSGIIPGYRKGFSIIPSNKMTGSVGLVANLYSASVATPENPSGSPEDIAKKEHHLKNGFTNPWPRYI